MGLLRKKVFLLVKARLCSLAPSIYHLIQMREGEESIAYCAGWSACLWHVAEYFGQHIFSFDPGKDQ